MSDARIVAVANQKGGVGKTTTAVNLSAYLGLGLRVLLVDLDPQANATSSLGLDARALDRSTYEVLLGELALRDIVQPIEAGSAHLALAPATRALAGAQIELVALPDRDQRLAASLDDVRLDYDLILIDCPPALGVLTLNALVAANLLLVPVQCEYLALEGVGQMLETLELVRATLNPRLELLGMVMTMFDPRTRLSSQVVDDVRRTFPDKTLETVIPRSVRLSEAPSYGQPMLTYDPTSRGATAYADLAQELLRRGLLR